jgi:hypothetical protein
MRWPLRHAARASTLLALKRGPRVRMARNFYSMQTLQLHIRSAKTFSIITDRPGVDVMITIFCDFPQFSPTKLAFFTNTNLMIKFLHNLALF